MLKHLHTYRYMYMYMYMCLHKSMKHKSYYSPMYFAAMSCLESEVNSPWRDSINGRWKVYEQQFILKCYYIRRQVAATCSDTQVKPMVLKELLENPKVFSTVLESKLFIFQDCFHLNIWSAIHELQHNKISVNSIWTKFTYFLHTSTKFFVHGSSKKQNYKKYIFF